MKWFYFFIGCGFTLTILYIIGTNPKIIEKLSYGKKELEIKRDNLLKKENKILEASILFASSNLEHYDNIFKSLIDNKALIVKEDFLPKSQKEWFKFLIEEAAKQLRGQENNGK